jgi:hypothetical protein
MKRRIWTVAAGLACVAALLVVPSALAVYTSAKLEVRVATTGVTIKALVNPDHDPTARVAIVTPVGTQSTTSQAPGTVLGPVNALVKALDLGGADLPLQGQLVVAAPGQVTAAAQTACIGPVVPLATWVMVLTAAGQTLTVPTYYVANGGATAALGPTSIVVCLPPPDVPAGVPGRATFGSKLYSAELTIAGVFSSAAGIWTSFWTPYNPGVGTANAAATVVGPAAVLPGALTVAAKRAGKGAIVSGRVTQGGQPRSGATVTIRGGARAGALKRLGSVKTRANGTYTFRARTGTFFAATAAAAPGSAPAVCTTLTPALGGLPCVNPTSNGFTAASRTIRKR